MYFVQEFINDLSINLPGVFQGSTCVFSLEVYLCYAQELTFVLLRSLTVFCQGVYLCFAQDFTCILSRPYLCVDQELTFVFSVVYPCIVQELTCVFSRDVPLPDQSQPGALRRQGGTSFIPR